MVEQKYGSTVAVFIRKEYNCIPPWAGYGIQIFLRARKAEILKRWSLAQGATTWTSAAANRGLSYANPGLASAAPLRINDKEY